ncbi:MAG: uracil-DNA glycosylase [Synergistaceae bacterium]|nr:uracil-DNA glycosylase [Synergistaceae bacterium]
MIDINNAWEELKRRVEKCENCELCKTRKNTVFGEGLQTGCRVVMIGEAPGEDEDIQGRPFVGKAGQKLTDIIEKGGNIKRSSIYIMNTIKCRPPNNRNPLKSEILACREFLEAQLLLLNPKIIVTLGNIPKNALLNNETVGITKLRGKWQKFRGIDLLPMYHPSYIIRSEGTSDEAKIKIDTWNDIKSLRSKMKEYNLI